MHRFSVRRSFAACLLVALLLTLTGAAQPAWAAKRCGTFDLGPLRYEVNRTGPFKCASAMRLVKHFILQHETWRKHGDGTVAGSYYTHRRRYPGWRCYEGSGGGGCRKGRRQAGYQNYAKP